MIKPVVLAMTGASGAIYAQRLLRTLLEADVEVHLTISQSGAAVIKQELDYTIQLNQFDAASFLQVQPQVVDTYAACNRTCQAGEAALSPLRELLYAHCQRFVFDARDDCLSL